MDESRVGSDREQSFETVGKPPDKFDFYTSRMVERVLGLWDKTGLLFSES